MKKIFLFLMVVLIFFNMIRAQDYPLSQPYSNPFWMCPSLVGNAEGPRISSFFRSQWPEVSGSYNTAALGLDAPVKAVYGGLGVYGVYDVSGENALKEWSINVIYSFRKEENENFNWRVATQYSFGHKYLDCSKLTFPDQIDPRHGFIFTTNEALPEDGFTKSYFDLGFSAAVDWKKWTAGVSSFHVLEPNVGFISNSPLKRTYIFFAGYDLWLMKGEKPEGFHVSPLAYYTTSPFGYSMLCGTNVSLNWLYFGAYCRFGESNADAVIFQLGSRFWHFQAGYSYDMTVSKLTNASGGSHEVFLNYLFNKNDKK
ncbi:MAG TPA: PorP/SprF family type IX secretion system membrane protein [Bacteroidales bacterium]|nr:PorP/SprF family type IX secretion system membrane protein [Bacteroidales bacterium]